jgi:hypothetical protein
MTGEGEGMRRTALFAIVCATALCSSAPHAQDFANAQLTGRVTGATGEGGPIDIKFSCTGTPTCQGNYSLDIRENGCSNTFHFEGSITFTGIEISRPGTWSGSVVLSGAESDDTPNPDGTCSIRPGTTGDHVDLYKGAWDGNNGTITVDGVDHENGRPYHLDGSFKADVSTPPPVFKMNVDTSIKDGLASSNAQIEFRPQDVGQTGSIYVFAMAPMSEVKDAVIDKEAPMQWFFRKSEKDLPVQCVLAQLSASGQLVGVSASTLQAYVTGVLSSQGAPVTILNGVPTVNIGGATFFVGYGSTGQSMLNGGINRSAVTIPGAQVCQPTAPQTGWWWNPAEDGRGFSVEKHGPNIFFASFLYDTSGRSTWYVSSGLSSLEGSLYVGDLLAASNGQTLGGTYPGFPTLTKVGTVTITFNSATNGTLVWPGGTVPIQRQPFIPNGLSLAPMANGIESGWWWNDAEAGRGFFMEFQGDWLDVAGYMYDDQGNPVWYLTVAQMAGASKTTFSNDWWSFGNGQTLTGPWKPNARTNAHVAPVTISFTGTDTATMTLPGGRSTNLKRHRF